MKLAAVDIGSNAIRLQITKVNFFQNKFNFKRLEYLRFPLRLGNDAFKNKEIGPENSHRLKELMRAFQILIQLYEVDAYLACATSAMREAKNGKILVEEIKSEIGLRIQLIDGNKEAALINKALWNHIDKKTYLHIDVGGGSTELNVFKNGKKTAAKSFRIGSVRTLEHPTSQPLFSQMDQFIKEHLSPEKSVIGIGTGGNINKVFELAAVKGKGLFLHVSKIKEVLGKLENFSTEERINLLYLNEDRADVIIPATKIYLAALEAAHVQIVMVPALGLKDGMIQQLFDKKRQEFFPAS